METLRLIIVVQLYETHILQSFQTPKLYGNDRYNKAPFFVTFDDTVFAFPSKDVFQGVLFGGFIPRLSEAGENATEKLHL